MSERSGKGAKGPSGGKPDLSTEIAGLRLKNPVIAASGTFGVGREYSDLVDLGRLGAIVVKTVTLRPTAGNPPPRMCETAAGMLNSIGLHNQGVDAFIEKDLPFLRDFDVPVIVSVAGATVADYQAVCRKLNAVDGIAAVELNISCPNVKAGGLLFGSRPEMASQVTVGCHEASRYPVIVKLTPNCGDIVQVARAVERAGASAISLINTIVGMAIDPFTSRPRLSTVTGGLSGPAIKPVALRMVWEVAREVKVPVIGMGGIMDALDAVEFLLAGASAIGVGTANFVRPRATVEIIDGLATFLAERRIRSVREIVGGLKVDPRA